VSASCARRGRGVGAVGRKVSAALFLLPSKAAHSLSCSDESSCSWDASEAGLPVSLSSRTAACRAEVFHSLENRQQAAHWFIEALRRDPLNYEAFAILKERHLLTSEQEEEVEHCLGACALDPALAWEMYGCKLSVYSAKQIPAASPLDMDLETARAENLYYGSRTADALHVCQVKSRRRDRERGNQRNNR
jgi:hypothetical protein